MKKLTSKKKLRLNKETMRNLTATDLMQVAGGTGMTQPLTTPTVPRPTHGTCTTNNCWTQSVDVCCA